MPNNYTTPVAEGKITELADFVLNSARAFGPFAALKESDTSLEATRRYIAEGAYLETTTYEEDAIARHRARLDELHAMTDEQALATARAEAEEVAKLNAERSSRVTEGIIRCGAMMSMVASWTPPTSGHYEFKDWMLKQLREAVDDFLVTGSAYDRPQVNLDWRSNEIKSLKRLIRSLEQRIADIHARNERRKDWVEALLASLEEPVHAGAPS